MASVNQEVPITITDLTPKLPIAKAMAGKAEKTIEDTEEDSDPIDIIKVGLCLATSIDETSKEHIKMSY